MYRSCPSPPHRSLVSPDGVSFPFIFICASIFKKKILSVRSSIFNNLVFIFLQFILQFQNRFNLHFPETLQSSLQLSNPSSPFIQFILFISCRFHSRFVLQIGSPVQQLVMLSYPGLASVAYGFRSWSAVDSRPATRLLSIPCKGMTRYRYDFCLTETVL